MSYTARPNIRASSHAVTAGHFLAAVVGHDVLRDGGNAIDAAAAVAFCLVVLEPHQNGLGGECPSLVHFHGKTHAISGQGTSPAALKLEWFREREIMLIPGDGLLPATVPSHVGTWLLMLREFGTMPLARLLEPAIDLAEYGFAVHASLSQAIDECRVRFRAEWPTSADVYLIHDRAPAVGERLKLPSLADTLRRLRNESARKKDRTEGLQAAYDWFYRGPAAAAIEALCSGNKFHDASGLLNPGFLTRDDLASWRPRIEQPIAYEYKDVLVQKCGAWTQGPVFLQQLAILSGFDLRSMGWGTADYWHTLIETAKLAFADREAYYGDPDFDSIPLGTLLSDNYNRGRRCLVSPREASARLRPGDPFERGALPEVDTVSLEHQTVSGPKGHVGDTTHLDVVDRWGNCVSATPSGGWLMSSPVIPDLGFALGTRGQMFYLDPSRPNAYQPRKRPRGTLTPSIAQKSGKPWLIFGTPGGDGQDQWTLQAFLNVVEFGMSPAEAVEAPTITVLAFPSSFYPRRASPRMVACESRISIDAMKELHSRGHEIDVQEPFSHGKPSMIKLEPTGEIEAAISSRAEVGYAIGW